MVHNRYREKFEHLQNQIAWLLVTFYIYRQKIIEETEPRNFSMASVEKLVIIEALGRDVALRLTKLDDDQSGTWSFRDAKKLLNEELNNQGHIKTINEAVKDFRSTINTLKVKHRNKYIAHLQEGVTSNLQWPKEPTKLHEMVRCAVRTFDILVSHEAKYLFGSEEDGFEIDLREAVM